MRKLLLLCFVLAATGCGRRVYWPQGHGHRAAVPSAPIILVLEEGRDYQGWSPALPKCQQRPFFPSHALKK